MDIVIPNATSIGVFAVASILLLLTPGPAVLYIVSRSVEQGRIAGLASVCGITTGTLVHVLAAALGLSALLASSAVAFAVVKYEHRVARFIPCSKATSRPPLWSWINRRRPSAPTPRAGEAYAQAAQAS